MTTTPEIAATWTDAGVTLRIRHLDVLGPDGLAVMAAELHRLAAALEQQVSYVTAATQPRTCHESRSMAPRTASQPRPGTPPTPTPRKALKIQNSPQPSDTATRSPQAAPPNPTQTHKPKPSGYVRITEGNPT